MRAMGPKDAPTSVRASIAWLFSDDAFGFSARLRDCLETLSAGPITQGLQDYCNVNPDLNRQVTLHLALASSFQTAS